MRALEGFRPAPERLWVRYRPRRWPSPAEPWTDWVRGTLGAAGRSGWEVPAELARAPDDVLYLPPVVARLEEHRRALGARCLRSATPVVYQLEAGSSLEPPAGATAIWDLLPALLEPKRSERWRLPAGASCVWPLIAGLTDGAEEVERGLARLRDAGAEAVQPLSLELSPATKRRLAAGADEAGFDRLFHAPPPSERDFARRTSALGLTPFIERPLPGGPPRLRLRRRCSGELRLAAELYHRLERSEAASQRLLRAARWIDREDRDLAALAEEGNLEIVDWLDAEARAVVQAIAADRRSELVERLLAEYVGARPADAP